ncbi:hypothetical protein AGMMS49928_16740 [Spirochaetia bacterium]|nr:hypothetical protein AGMMS49928_16740 [Spirochaetia bacterium]
MNAVNRRCFFALLFFGLSLPLFSASLDELLGTEGAASLIAAESFSGVQLKDPAARFLPRHAEVRRIFGETWAALGPKILVENISLYKKPGGTVQWTEAERVGLYNGALALGTLAGLQYYSPSRKAMRTFYETSTVISGPANKTPLPDPEYAEPPAALTMYARQKDLTFGDNIYRYDYHASSDALVFIQQNVTAMNAGIIPAVGKNNLYSLVAVMDAGEYLLIYIASMVKALSFPGMGNRIGNSFSARTEAILKWYTGQADKVFINKGGLYGSP